MNNDLELAKNRILELLISTNTDAGLIAGLAQAYRTLCDTEHYPSVDNKSKTAPA